MENKTYYALDIAKFISALFVICIHTGPFIDINTDLNFVVVQIISRIAVPFFFVSSGFLFFNKIDFSRSWKDQDNIFRLRNYMIRLFKIYCIWTLLYLPFTIILLRAREDGMYMHSILQYLRDFFINGSYYHLWFLPALLLAVPFVYLIIGKWGTKKAIIVGCILYSMGTLINVYPQVLDKIPVVNRVVRTYISLASTARNGLFFGTIFISMGAFFAKRTIKINDTMLRVGLIISFVLYVGECVLLRRNGYMNNLTSMYSMLLPCLFFLFLILIYTNLQTRPIYIILRKISLLIYVSHIMFTIGIIIYFQI